MEAHPQFQDLFPTLEVHWGEGNLSLQHSQEEMPSTFLVSYNLE